MIIVYYDSAVQSAFEELVKFVSGSRNAMRKGRMAARMAEMRRAAEMEVDADGESETDDDGLPQLSGAVPRKSTLAAARNGEPSAARRASFRRLIAKIGAAIYKREIWWLASRWTTEHVERKCDEAIRRRGARYL
jgi:hypothetical protein